MSLQRFALSLRLPGGHILGTSNKDKRSVPIRHSKFNVVTFTPNIPPPSSTGLHGPPGESSL